MDATTAYRTFCACAIDLQRPFEETPQAQQLLEGGGATEKEMSSRLSELRREVERMVAGTPGQIVRIGLLPGIKTKRYARIRTANSTRVIKPAMIEEAVSQCTAEGVRAELASASKSMSIIDCVVKIMDREVRRLRTTLRESLAFTDELPRGYPEDQIVFASDHLQETVAEMERLKARLAKRRKLRGGYQKQLKERMAQAEAVVLEDLRRRETTTQPLTINFQDEPRRYNVKMRTTKKTPSVTVPVFRNMIRESVERKFIGTLTPDTVDELLTDDSLRDLARIIVGRYESFREPRESVSLKLEAIRVKKPVEESKKRSREEMEAQ